MTAPLSNTRVNVPTGRDSRQPGGQPEAAAERAGTPAGRSPQVTGRQAPPPDSARLQTPAQARAALAQIQAAIAASPQAAISAQAGVSREATAATLRTAA
jgi:hypothetical protein